MHLFTLLNTDDTLHIILNAIKTVAQAYDIHGRVCEEARCFTELREMDRQEF